MSDFEASERARLHMMWKLAAGEPYPHTTQRPLQNIDISYLDDPSVVGAAFTSRRESHIYAVAAAHQFSASALQDVLLERRHQYARKARHTNTKTGETEEIPPAEFPIGFVDHEIDASSDIYQAVEHAEEENYDTDEYDINEILAERREFYRQMKGGGIRGKRDRGTSGVSIFDADTIFSSSEPLPCLHKPSKGETRCNRRAIPFTSFCYYHLLDEPSQNLFVECEYVLGRKRCKYPVLRTMKPSLCALHAEAMLRTKKPKTK